ncbi:hypothetical protein [Kineosporia succinea]|uniref:Coat F domain-containing protein n=1 Tax=Kineosporia succinea TaxID=84632 RepID=A0ABT9P9Q1_9ACTN|nr:hypothetical protein [Kineosporia succinea]MDP9829420.1 hypothetical protein [Kineosporia succinea]
MSSTTTMLELPMDHEQIQAMLSLAIGALGESRLLIDTLGRTGYAVDPEKLHQAQYGLMQILNHVPDGHPAPKLSQVHAARVETAMTGVTQ